MTEPLRLSFELNCSAAHAFTVWTEQISRWWPADHTVSGRSESVVIQAGVGGRIYERTAEGAEHDWGQVTVWEPPYRLGYQWHLGQPSTAATEVEICFLDQGAASTRVEIEHRGWQRLGTAADQLRTRNNSGWQSLLPHYLDYLAAIEGKTHLMAAGTVEDPWTLSTPPGTSQYQLYADPGADPPALVCQVGSTTLRYRLSAIDDLHRWLVERGDWVALGAADEKKQAAEGSVEAWGRSPDNPVGGWYGLRNGYRGRFGMYIPPLLELLGLAELTHEPRNNRIRAIER